MRRLAVFPTVLLLLLLVGISSATAHSDEGLLALETTRSDEPLGVRVRARLVYANDRDPVSSATVTVEATGPNGATVAPRVMASEGDGAYTSVLVFPVAGAWTVRAKSSAPVANALVEYRAVAPTTTATTTTTTTTSTSVPDTRDAGAARAGDTADGNGGLSGLLVVGTAALLVAIGGALLWWRARYRATQSIR